MGKSSLPPNWKRAKNKDGTIYYHNPVTKEQRSTEPRPLPRGWDERLHKDSGRVIYYHAQKRRTQFTFPTADDAGSDDDEPVEIEAKRTTSMMGSLLKSFGGKKKGSLTSRDSKTHDPKDLARLASSESAPVRTESHTAAEEGASRTKEIYISCSTLIREVKLCVSPESHPDSKELCKQLDELYDALHTKEISSTTAVKHLTAMVGSTIVQQARGLTTASRPRALKRSSSGARGAMRMTLRALFSSREQG